MPKGNAASPTARVGEAVKFQSDSETGRGSIRSLQFNIILGSALFLWFVWRRDNELRTWFLWCTICKIFFLTRSRVYIQCSVSIEASTTRAADRKRNKTGLESNWKRVNEKQGASSSSVTRGIKRGESHKRIGLPSFPVGQPLFEKVLADRYFRSPPKQALSLLSAVYTADEQLFVVRFHPYWISASAVW